ncbi:hypothetical protein [Escherichia coli]|uniref:hypothetical protein n=1 Tax=Escherichia coli TaxID=562 RepID=UPI003CF2D069
MMNPVPWLQMTNMISYQGLVRTFPKSDLSVNAICNGNYTTNLNGKIFGVTATSYRFGGQTAAGTRHLFGHIRNFRVWFKELNDRQIKEAV